MQMEFIKYHYYLALQCGARYNSETYSSKRLACAALANLPSAIRDSVCVKFYEEFLGSAGPL